MDTSYYYDEVISSQLDALDSNLRDIFKKYKIEYSEYFDLKSRDLEYNFMDRVETLALNKSGMDSLLFPIINHAGLEDAPSYYLPNKFGVQRGYAGGGMHSGLQESEYYQLEEALTEAGFKEGGQMIEDILQEFRATFWAILKGFDAVNSELAGREPEIWESASL